MTELFWGDRVGRVRDPSATSGGCKATPPDVPEQELQSRMQDLAMLEAMRYVQQSLVDALRNQRNRQG